jgi:hypothetical protein
MGRENRTGIFEMPQDPELEDLFRVKFRELQLELRTNTVGRVVTYYPETQTVDVTTEILQVYKDLETAPTKARPNPERLGDPTLLSGLPVAWPRTSSGYLTFPINPGDTGEIRVHDRSLQRWLELGQAVDPVSAWLHTLGSGVFSPTLYPSTDPISPATDQTATVLHGELIKLHRDALDFVALSEKVMTELQAFRTWANTHTHTGVTTGIGSTGTGTPKGAVGSVAAENVKAK